MPKPPRSPAEKGIALGTIVYDALLLALSLQVRRDGIRYGASVPGTDFRKEPQIALELMVVKCRALDDVLMSKSTNPDDVVASDFSYTRSPGYGGLAGTTFRVAVNKRTAHLTWTRVDDWPLANWESVGAGVETYACDVLKETLLLVKHALANGETLSTKHDGHWQTLQATCARIC